MTRSMGNEVMALAKHLVFSMRLAYSTLSYLLPAPVAAWSHVLELAFTSKELRSACQDAACAEAVYGRRVAQALVGRLADLRAASHPLDSPFAEIRPASAGDPEHVVVYLIDGRSLVIACNHEKPPRDGDGLVKWEQVHRVIILRLE